jgi:hypothetical protein
MKRKVEKQKCTKRIQNIGILCSCGTFCAYQSLRIFPPTTEPENNTLKDIKVWIECDHEATLAISQDIEFVQINCGYTAFFSCETRLSPNFSTTRKAGFEIKASCDRHQTHDWQCLKKKKTSMFECLASIRADQKWIEKPKHSNVEARNGYVIKPSLSVPQTDAWPRSGYVRGKFKAFIAIIS